MPCQTDFPVTHGRRRLCGLSRASTLALLVTLAAPVAARADEHPVDGVIVTSPQVAPNVKVVTRETLDATQPDGVGDIFRRVPGMGGVAAGDDPSSILNIRGLQDSGRVVVTLDGARQDFSRPLHSGSGSFYLDPEIVKTIVISRGPGAVAGGAGGIAGTVAFRTIDPVDLLGAEGRWALGQKVSYETNDKAILSSTTGALRLSDRAAVLANFVYRDQNEARDGAGRKILYSAQTPQTVLLKGVAQPADGHEVALTASLYRNDYVVTRSPGTSSATRSLDDTDADSQTYSGRWSFRPTGSRLFDMVTNASWSRTEVGQTKIAGTPASSLGERRLYDFDTLGLNWVNTSRLSDTYALTLGADAFWADGASTDPNYASGELDVYGGFAQLAANYGAWELVGALRFDTYRLEGANKAGLRSSSSDERLSPQVTVGYHIAPKVTIYALYSEGMRAPTIVETFRGNGGGAFQPNLDLKSETARNIEGGLKFQLDDALHDGDRLRIDLNGFRTDIDNYIDTVTGGGGSQARNVGDARLEGVELDARYDRGSWYLAVAGSVVDAGVRVGANRKAPLNDAPLNKLSTTVGVKLLDGAAYFGVEHLYVASIIRDSANKPPSDSYNLVNLHAGWTLDERLTLRVNVNNLFDVAYDDPQAKYAVTAPTSNQGRGRSVRFTVSSRFGG